MSAHTSVPRPAGHMSFRSDFSAADCSMRLAVARRSGPKLMTTLRRDSRLGPVVSDEVRIDGGFVAARFPTAAAAPSAKPFVAHPPVVVGRRRRAHFALHRLEQRARVIDLAANHHALDVMRVL